MPEGEEEEVLQMFQLEMSKFGKSNLPRLRIIEDLSLSCDVCKTPEAKTSISEMTRRYFDELKREEATLNKSIDQMLKKAAQKSKDSKTDKKSQSAMEKKAKQMIDKWTGIHIGKNSKLTLKFNGLKKLPYVVIDGKF